MTTRDELVNALARRYAVAGKAEKSLILDEFEAITGMHRKHAMRLLRSGPSCRAAEGRAGRRIYDAAVCEALVVVWEASDRICGKRLKALMPTLVEAMERHGHLELGPEIRAGLLAMSAATIDRSLREVRAQAGGRMRRRTCAVVLGSRLGGGSRHPAAMPPGPRWRCRGPSPPEPRPARRARTAWTPGCPARGRCRRPPASDARSRYCPVPARGSAAGSRHKAPSAELNTVSPVNSSIDTVETEHDGACFGSPTPSTESAHSRGPFTLEGSARRRRRH